MWDSSGFKQLNDESGNYSVPSVSTKEQQLHWATGDALCLRPLADQTDTIQEVYGGVAPRRESFQPSICLLSATGLLRKVHIRGTQA